MSFTVKDLDNMVEKHLKGGNKPILKDLLERARLQAGGERTGLGAPNEVGMPVPGLPEPPRDSGGPGELK